MRIIRDPEKVQTLVEKSRWEIWKFLRDEGQQTAEAIAEQVDKNVSTVYRHLRKLIDAGFVKEHDIQKGEQKYIVKEYSAELTDAFFILSEEVEYLIAASNEVSYLEDAVPNVLTNLKHLGFAPLSKNDEKKAKEMISNLSIKLSNFLADRAGETLPINYNHNFEIMRRILAMFLSQTDLKFKTQVEELRKILNYNNLNQ